LIPEAVAEIVGNLPYMRLREARIFYDLIQSQGLSRVLELGFFHGVSSTYLAGALAEGRVAGHLTTIDLLTARERSPNIEYLLNRAGLRDLVEIWYEERSFNWRLLEFLREGRSECFDLCYFDGAHTWYDTGFAFCLVERLLAPGGWIVFDDLYFSFRESRNRDKSWVRKLPEQEQTSQQVRYVFELLVETNPQWTNFRRVNGRFAFAQKKDRVKSESEYLSTSTAVAVSRALELAHKDPEFRNELVLAPQHALAALLPSSTPMPERVHFVEGDHKGPRPAIWHPDQTFTISLERPFWEFTSSRLELDRMLNG
jgi:predicted O-methyltransferase YrrM